MTRIFLSGFMILIIMIDLSIYAQPSNDDIASAISLNVDANSATSGTNSGATTVVGDPVGSTWVGGTVSHSVWYSFTAPSSGNVTVTTDHSGGTLNDSQVAVYSSSDGTSSGTLTEVGSNDDINGPGNLLSSVKLTGLTPGDTYFIEVDGYSNLTGTFYIDVHDGKDVLINDDCANAMNLWVGQSCNFQYQCTYTNFPSPVTNATGEAWETAPGCWSQGTTLNTVWFKFTAVTVTTRLQIPTNDGSSSTDPHVAVYSGTCGSLTLVACQEDLSGGGGPGSTNRGVDLSFSTTVGATYYIQYDSDAAGGCNNICLSATGGLSAPANDNCASATALSENTAVTGNTWLASADGSFSGGTVENSVWYKFTPASNGTFNFNLTNQNGCSGSNNTASTHTGFYAANLQMAVYNIGTCTPTSANEISYASYLNTNNIELSANLISGNTYLVMVDGMLEAGCSFSIKASGTSLLPVNLLSFSGHSKGNANALRWITASEKNNDRFTIERAGNDREFKSIGEVKGAGNSTSIRTYSYTDNLPLEGINYYRLVQTDYDGQINYPGQVISVAPQGYSQQNFHVSPNPGNGGAITVKIENAQDNELILRVTDALGKLYYSKKVNIDQWGTGMEVILPASRLVTGVYLVTAIGKNTAYNKRIIINNN